MSGQLFGAKFKGYPPRGPLWKVVCPDGGTKDEPVEWEEEGENQWEKQGRQNVSLENVDPKKVAQVVAVNADHNPLLLFFLLSFKSTSVLATWSSKPLKFRVSLVNFGDNLLCDDHLLT